MKEYLNETLYSLRRSKIRVFTALAKSTPGCIGLTLGEPDFDTPAEIEAEVQTAFDNHETHYIANNGTAELRAKIAEFEHDRYGMDYTADEVVITAGATEALFVSLYSVLNPGDEVIIPAPAFSLYREQVEMCRGRCVLMDISRTGFQIDENVLNGLINERTKAILLNSPNNPSGGILNRNSLDIIHRAVKDRNIFVICDDVYRQLVYIDDYHSMMEYRDLREKLILVQSFSKPYAMTGWRMGYLCADAKVMPLIQLVHQFMVTSTPAPFQRACIRALDCDVAPFRDEYRRRRDFVRKRLAEIGLETPAMEGGFYAFPSIEKFGMSDDEFCTRMIREAGLAAIPGSDFGVEGHIRLTYCYSSEELKEGFDRLEKFVRSLEK